MALSSDFEELYKQFHPELVAFAMYYIKSENDSLEIVNDVFLSVWKKKDQLKLDSSLKSYLYTSVKNTCFNFLKKRGLSLVNIDDQEEKSDQSQTSDFIEVKESVAHIHKVLKMLPPKCKHVFLLSRVAGFSNKEIAALLEVSIKTVENQMTKALKIFRENLKLE